MAKRGKVTGAPVTVRNTKWSQKDYEMVASVLKDGMAQAYALVDNLERVGAAALCVYLAEQFAYTFQKDNKRFKSHLFHKAAGTFPASMDE